MGRSLLSGRAARRALLLGVAVMAGCGGAEDAPRQRTGPAISPEQFRDRFAELTGVSLEIAPGDQLGTRLDVPERPDRYVRFGTYSLVWARDRSDRRALLGVNPPNASGIRWQRDGAGWSAREAFGEHLVLAWQGGAVRRTSPQWRRLERAVRAAYRGDVRLLSRAERPCGQARLDPLRGAPGSCSVDGVPVTFTDAPNRLRTRPLSARVLGVETAEAIGSKAPKAARGRFVVVAYSVTNESARPLRFLQTQLRLGRRSVPEDGVSSVLLARSRGFPLPPGETIEARAAFDVDPSLAARARPEGAFVVPAALDEGDPSAELAQAWIRLAQAPAGLGAPPRRDAPAGGATASPAPEGPPPIAFEAGDGAAIGGTTRRLYMANTYSSLPQSFRAGGVPTGSRAGGCVVPAPSADDRRALLDGARRATPRGDVRRLLDRNILLADCGEQGRWAMLSWEQHGAGDGVILRVDELALEGGRWQGTPPDTPPGCRIPDDAAAAWQIDISICDDR